MKKVLMIAVCLAGVAFQSCKKSTNNVTQNVTVDAKVAAGQTYSLNLNGYGSKAVITSQATNYSESTVAKAGSTITYNYVPVAAKGTYTDQVVVAVTKEGRCNKADSTIVTVNLSVQ